MKRGEQMKTLQAEEQRLEREIEGLQIQLAQTRRLMKLLGGEAPDEAPPAPRRKPPSPIKDAVLGLLGEHKEAGLSVNEVIELSQRRGQPLDRASVSSLLSRLKREHVLTADGGKYRIAAPDPTPGPRLNVVR
jgi:hypothetical protein